MTTGGFSCTTQPERLPVIDDPTGCLILNRGTADILLGDSSSEIKAYGTRLSPGQNVVYDLSKERWIASTSGSQSYDILPGASSGVFGSNSAILLKSNLVGTVAPVNSGTSDVSGYNSLLIALKYDGQLTGPPLTDFMQFQFLWYDSDGFTNPLTGLIADPIWVDTFEINSEVPGSQFVGKWTFVNTPIRGSFLQILSNTGTGGAATPTVKFKIYGSQRNTTKFVLWQDMPSFQGTDLTLGALGGTLAQPAFPCGVGSGPFIFTGAAAWGAGAAANSVCRLRFSFGSTGLGPADLNLTNVAGGAITVSQAFSALLARRPLTVQTIFIGTAPTNWNWSIVRDEP